MTINFEEEYNREFPERYNWDLLDSFKLTRAAGFIQAEALKDLCTDGRHFLPGLRKALNVIYDTDQCNR